MDEEIDMYWNNEQPHEDVNANNFSVIWTGFIKSPVSDEFTFELINDDGGILLVNNDIVIQDRLKPDTPITDFLEPKRKEMKDAIAAGKWDDFIKPNAALITHYANKSDKIKLEAGQFVPIEIRYIHSVHNSLQEDGTAFCALWWSSAKVNRQIVPQH